MAVILFTWELGSGHGHLGRMVPVAQELAARGHRPVFAVRQLREAASLLAESPFPILQAPCWHPRGRKTTPDFQAGTYADLLGQQGYDDAADLECMVRGWEALLDLVRPDLVVADHSPTACLAARERLPLALLGDGFTIPPATGRTFVPLRDSTGLNDIEARILNNTRTILNRRERTPPDSLPEAFSASSRFLVTFAELDPYRAVRNSEGWLGPLRGWSPPVSPSGPPRILAYLSADYPHAVPILLAFAEAGIECSVTFRDGLPVDVDRLRARVTVHAQPPRLDAVLPSVSAVVHHASLNTTMAALVAGRPQLVLPRHLEQDLTAGALRTLGVGQVLGGKLTLAQIGSSLRGLIEDPTTAARCQELAHNLHERGAEGCLEGIVNRCLDLV